MTRVGNKSGWKSAPLWSLFRRVKNVGHPNEQMLSVYRDLGVVTKDDRSDNHNKTAENRNIYQLVDEGWLVVNRMKAWQGSIGISQHKGIVSGHYLCFEPRHSENSRFLNHLVRSGPYTAELRRLSRGVRPSQAEIDNDLLRTLSITLPPVDEQRAIADYLDAETARIDALITKKQQLIHLLSESYQANIDQWFDELSSRHGKVVLRRLVSGIEQGWSPVCDGVPAGPGEWGVLKTSAVSSGNFTPQENKRLPADVEPDLRWRVLDGDLLATRGSGSRSMVARFCVARPMDRLLTISDLIYRLRLEDGDSDFVAAAMRSSSARSQVESSIRTDVGQTLKVRRDDLADLLVPALPSGKQRSEFLGLDDKLHQLRSVKDLLESQLDLLSERRQALITAAVIGEFTVPGVA